jgi:hypothetical protein
VGWLANAQLNSLGLPPELRGKLMFFAHGWMRRKLGFSAQATSMGHRTRALRISSCSPATPGGRLREIAGPGEHAAITKFPTKPYLLFAGYPETCDVHAVDEVIVDGE